MEPPSQPVTPSPHLPGAHPAVASSIALWHDMVARRDLGRLASICRADAVFRSPMAAMPYPSARAVVTVLEAVVEIFEDFVYHRQFVDADGLSVVLEFSARVGDRQLKGVDLIRFDTSGRIAEFEVMVRPLSGLQALGARMAERVGHRLAEFREPARNASAGGEPAGPPPAGA